MTSEQIDEKDRELTWIMYLDALAERYKMLPSQVMTQATTFDLVVMDIAVSYKHHAYKKQSGEMPEYSQDQLQAIIDRTRKNEK